MSEQNSEPSRPFDPPVPPTEPPTAPPTPPTPPAPPAPPAPELPPVPQYGEYAPVAPSNPYGVPGYPTAAASTQATPAAPAYGATNPYATPTYGAPAYAPIGRPRKTWDLVLTIVLLVVGAIGALIGATAGLGLNQAIQQQYDAKNLGIYNGNNGTTIAILAISHVVLYLLAVGFSILSLVKKRTTFWIPLVAGVVAAIVFWGVLISVIVGDSTLMNALTAS